jgi:hypothetical protein
MTMGLLLMWMVLIGSEDAAPRALGVERQQLAGVFGQVPDDDLVLVGGVLRQRPHHGQAAALGGVAAAQVHEGLAMPHLLHHRGLVAQAQAEVPQARLAFADQACHRDGGVHVGQRVVRRLVQQPVGAAQVFEPERRPAGEFAFGVARPFDALGAQ